MQTVAYRSLLDNTPGVALRDPVGRVHFADDATQTWQTLTNADAPACNCWAGWTSSRRSGWRTGTCSPGSSAATPNTSAWRPRKGAAMKTTQIQKDHLLYRLQVVSSTLAEVIIQQVDGAVVEHREYVGPRAEALALVAWSKATGLVGGAR